MDQSKSILERAIGEGRNALSEHESKGFLRACGIPVTREIEVIEPGGLRAALQEIGFPLVMKASSHRLLHKSERGLVRIDIRNEAEAEAAFREIRSSMDEENGAVLVQEMIRGKRELMVGMTRDPQFGPCVMFGLGGIFTEVLKDVSFRVAPLERRDALEMMREIRARRILEEIRGLPAADMEQLAGILIRVGEIGLRHEAIREIDLNPLILDGGRPVAVDALIVLG
jgi:acetyl-CoA synthetase (ADP-forming)